MPRADAAATVALHAAAFAAVYLWAFAIRFDGAIPSGIWASIERTVLPLVLLKTAAFLAMGCHRGRWGSATFAELTGLAEAALLGSVLALPWLLIGTGPRIPRSVIVLDWAGATLGLCGARLAGRLLRERYRPMLAACRLRRVVIVGAGPAAEAMVRAIGAQPQLGLKVLGLLEDDPALRGRDRAGVPVLGSTVDLEPLAARYRLELVLVPTPATPAERVRGLVDACRRAGIPVQIVPSFAALLRGNLVLRPRDVDIHDLLGRAPVRLEGRAIAELVEDRVVVVTGAAGSIGSEICRQVLEYRPARLVLLDHSENGLFFLERELSSRRGRTEVIPCLASIHDRARLRSVFGEYRPDVVFHAAAHKHVPLVEANPGEAVKNNVLGTRTVADEAVRCRAEAFVLISTDKAVNPTSVMGACKRLAEGYVHSLAGKSLTWMMAVRFGNVLGSNGSVVPIFQQQIGRGGPVTVTHPEMTRYFMTIPEAAGLVLQAAALGRGGEIFVLDMGEPVRVLDLARDMIRLSGQEIEIQFTGLRPGEKLAEELSDSDEDLLPTSHPKIRAMRHRSSPTRRLVASLEQLEAVVDRSADEVIDALCELLPCYRPNRPGRADGDSSEVVESERSDEVAVRAEAVVACGA
ncbi:MAG: polysaccharide biosynthesis protein [Isosphaeraceae bacterium]